MFEKLRSKISENIYGSAQTQEPSNSQPKNQSKQVNKTYFEQNPSSEKQIRNSDNLKKVIPPKPTLTKHSIFTIGYVTFNISSVPQMLQKQTKKTLQNKYNKNPITHTNWEKTFVLENVISMFTLVTKSDQKAYRMSKHYVRYLADEKDEMAISIKSNINNPLHNSYFFKVQFSNLKNLNLSKCNIRSIQGMGFINSPNLQLLQLHSNGISSLQPLSKSYLPRLRCLTLFTNCFQQLNPLRKSNFYMLTQIQLDIKIPHSNPIAQDKVIIINPPAQNVVQTFFKTPSFKYLSKLYMDDARRLNNWSEIFLVSQNLNKIKMEVPMFAFN